MIHRSWIAAPPGITPGGAFFLCRRADTRVVRVALVTGGAGFLGSHLVDELLARGQRVVVLDNLETGTPANLEHAARDDRFELVSHDVRVPFPDLGAVDVVYHLASPASPQHYREHPIRTLDVAFTGTQNALAFAQRAGARFLLASSSEVYGDPIVHPQPETYFGNVNPVGPRGPYGEGKRVAETLTTVWAQEAGVDATIARPFNVYGPRMAPNDGRVVPTFVRQALAGEPLTVFGDGTQTRSLCYVRDAVEGLRALAESDHPGPMNLGNPDEISMLQLATGILELSGSRGEVTFVEADGPYGAGREAHRRCPDVSLALEVLGWAPSTSLDDGIRRTIAHATEASRAV